MRASKARTILARAGKGEAVEGRGKAGRLNRDLSSPYQDVAAASAGAGHSCLCGVWCIGAEVKEEVRAASVVPPAAKKQHEPTNRGHFLFSFAHNSTPATKTGII